MSEIEKMIEILSENWVYAPNLNRTKPVIAWHMTEEEKSIVLDALREKQEREKGCEYCEKAKRNKYFRPIDKATMCGLPLRFCPMCGKKL
jgi:hypothetical protein